MRMRNIVSIAGFVDLALGWRFRGLGNFLSVSD